MKTVLIVDDSAYMRSLIRIALKKAGYEVVGEAGNGETAIDLGIELNPDLITLDNILPDMNGLDVFQTLRADGINAKIVMVSALGWLVGKAKELGVTNYVEKPFESDQLISVIDGMFAKDTNIVS